MIAPSYCIHRTLQLLLWLQVSNNTDLSLSLSLFLPPSSFLLPPSLHFIFICLSVSSFLFPLPFPLPPALLLLLLLHHAISFLSFSLSCSISIPICSSSPYLRLVFPTCCPFLSLSLCCS